MYLMGKPGHYILGQASILQKLIEEELLVERPGSPRRNVVPWDPDPYFMTDTAAMAEYKGERMEETIRRREWKLANRWSLPKASLVCSLIPIDLPTAFVFGNCGHKD
jgi:hypothetical protein